MDSYISGKTRQVSHRLGLEFWTCRLPLPEGSLTSPEVYYLSSSQGGVSAPYAWVDSHICVGCFSPHQPKKSPKGYEADLAQPPLKKAHSSPFLHFKRTIFLVSLPPSILNSNNPQIGRKVVWCLLF